MVLVAQLEIGHLSNTFVDASRNNRDIGCEIYYPATAEGDNTAAADGQFPVIVFGHGFVMGYEAYENLWTDLVPEGYVMAFVTTEGGFAPDHQDYGLDLSFVSAQIGALAGNQSSPLFEHLTDRRAIAGHSMGGGATWLSAASNETIDCIIGLAPAETNPSAIAAGGSVNVPVLVLSGNADGVTPPADHHIPIYEGSASACKVFVNILEGSHCYFANSGSLCDFGEFNPGNLSREEQQEITRVLMLNWCDYFLKSDAAAIGDFVTYYEGNTNLEVTSTCVFSSVDERNQAVYLVYPNPLVDSFVVELRSFSSPSDLILRDELGRSIPFTMESKEEVPGGRKYLIQTGSISRGVYFLSAPKERWSVRLVKD